MGELKHKYHKEKQVVDCQVMMTIKQQKNRMKQKEQGIEYP